MKAMTARRSATICPRRPAVDPCPYPNAADRRYYLEKALDMVLGAVIFMALAVILLFLMVL